MSIDFIFDLLIRAFFSRGDSVVCHSELCLFVSGSYSKTHVSSPVITCSKKSGLPLTRSKSSQEIETQFAFCSSVKTLGTNLSQIFLHLQVCHDDFMDNGFWKSHLICYQSNTQTSVRVQNRFHLSHIVRSVRR